MIRINLHRLVRFSLFVDAIQCFSVYNYLQEIIILMFNTKYVHSQSKNIGVIIKLSTNFILHMYLLSKVFSLEQVHFHGVFYVFIIYISLFSSPNDIGTEKT
jgi:hypothetical protein